MHSPQHSPHRCARPLGRPLPAGRAGALDWACALRVGLLPVGLLGALLLAGCTPSIGDSCNTSTDCSVRGDRICDTEQPGGYCTLNCAPDSCPDKAACVLFQASVPGCPYDDFQSPSRTARAYCVKTCQKDSDCRQSDGYVCQDPHNAPYNALILDDNQSQKVCVPGLDYSVAPVPEAGEASVCLSTGPQVPAIEAGVNLADVGVPSADAAGEAGPDVALDGGAEVGAEAGTADAGVDADAVAEGGSAPPEAGPDADAGVDAGAADVSPGG